MGLENNIEIIRLSEGVVPFRKLKEIFENSVRELGWEIKENGAHQKDELGRKRYDGIEFVVDRPYLHSHLRLDFLPDKLRKKKVHVVNIRIHGRSDMEMIDDYKLINLNSRSDYEKLRKKVYEKLQRFYKAR